MEVGHMNEFITIDAAAQAGRKGAWTITLGAESLTFAAVAGDESFEITRIDTEEKTELRNPGSGNPLFIVSIPKKIIFKLESAQAATLDGWLGPPTIKGLKIALRRRLRWGLPIGILFVFSSIPLSADPGAGLEAVPFDALSAFLGASLIFISFLSRIWPRRILFLMDSVWFSLLALDVAVDIFRGASILWIFLVCVLFLGAKGSLMEYRRFASVNLEPEPLGTSRVL